MDQSGHFFEKQQIMQTQPTSFGHSPIGALSNTNDFHAQANADNRGRTQQPFI
jgi:hypothetical protein